MWHIDSGDKHKMSEMGKHDKYNQTKIWLKSNVFLANIYQPKTYRTNSVQVAVIPTFTNHTYDI